MIEIVENKDHHLLAEMNEEIQSLHHHLYPGVFKSYDKIEISGFFQDVLSHEHVKAFVAFENQKPLGYVLLFVNTLEENPFQYKRRSVLLDQMLVLKTSRSRGVGKLLIGQTLSFARSLDIDVVELNHWTLNESARRFFNRNGFTCFNEKMSINL